MTGTKIPYVIQDRRQGDITAMFANANLADKELNWTTKYSVEQMCKSLKRYCYGIGTKSSVTEGLRNKNWNLK